MTLHFDEQQEFEGNLQQFLKHLESEDPEMGAIFSANIEALKNVVDEQSRKQARSTFNTGIVEALQSLEGDSAVTGAK